MATLLLHVVYIYLAMGFAIALRNHAQWGRFRGDYDSGLYLTIKEALIWPYQIWEEYKF
jgi:hypothetical protein